MRTQRFTHHHRPQLILYDHIMARYSTEPIWHHNDNQYLLDLNIDDVPIFCSTVEYIGNMEQFRIQSSIAAMRYIINYDIDSIYQDTIDIFREYLSRYNIDDDFCIMNLLSNNMLIIPMYDNRFCHMYYSY